MINLLKLPFTDFIKQREISALGFGERRDDVAKMRRERRERLRDGLLVADVGEDSPDHRKAAAVRGDRETARRHRREQADRLQGDGLAAGVRTGHDEDAKVATRASCVTIAMSLRIRSINFLLKVSDKLQFVEGP